MTFDNFARGGRLVVKDSHPYDTTTNNAELPTGACTSSTPNMVSNTASSSSGIIAQGMKPEIGYQLMI